jgi:hypothetical protein
MHRKKHRDINNHKRTQNLLKIKFGEEFDNLPKCRICKEHASNLTQHVILVHGYNNVDEYKKEFSLEIKDIYHKSYLDKCGENFRGDKNPGFNHGGKFSPYSKNFIKLDDMDDVEKSIYLKGITEKSTKSRKDNCNVSTSKEYWIKRGYTEEESKEMVRKRNSFTKEKCITKYGEEAGLVFWKNRQIKWQNTLKSKSLEEIDRINRAKMFKRSYSKVSQELFWLIYKEIRHEYRDIFFATLGEDGNRVDLNNEYGLYTTKNRFRYLDFYITDVNKCIEFDGDYWHGQKRGNQERDKEREIEIRDSLMDIKIHHVKENDFRSNPQLVLEECLEFIRNG